MRGTVAGAARGRAGQLVRVREAGGTQGWWRDMTVEGEGDRIEGRCAQACGPALICHRPQSVRELRARVRQKDRGDAGSNPNVDGLFPPASVALGTHRAVQGCAAVVVGDIHGAPQVQQPANQRLVTAAGCEL